MNRRTENVFTLAITAAFVIIMYTAGAGGFSVFGFFFLLNLNDTP